MRLTLSPTVVRASVRRRVRRMLAVVAVLGHTLQVIRAPQKRGNHLSAPTISPAASGEFERLITSATYEILQRNAAAQANSNPTW